MLAQRLKSLRATTPYTQAQTADAIGVARTTYAMYEQGKREPDNETLNAIADYYKVSTDYLLGRTDDPNPAETSNLKAWLRQTNSDLNEEQLDDLEEDIEDYLAARMKRILDKKK